MVRIESKKELLHSELSRSIIGCCFKIAKELGAGFLENVYKNALLIEMEQSGLNVFIEQSYEVVFRGHKIGRYIADLVVNNLVIVELKCCKVLLPEHKAQLINYLKASGLPIGILVNFGHQRLEYKRLEHPDMFSSNPYAHTKSISL